MEIQSLSDQEATALAYFDRGIPSVNPDDTVAKRLTEHHRWGAHRDEFALPTKCPVCKRNTERGA